MVNATQTNELILTIPEADSGVNAIEARDGIQVNVTLPQDAALNYAITFLMTAPNGAQFALVQQVTAADIASGTKQITLPTSFIALDGQYSLVATLKDGLNTIGNQATMSFDLDKTPPAKPAAPTSYEDNEGDIQSAANIQTYTDDTKPGINVGKNLVDTPKLYVDGVLVESMYNAATGTLTPLIALTEGKHTFAYTLTDAAQNVSTRSNQLTLVIDTTAPIYSSSDKASVDENVSVNTLVYKAQVYEPNGLSFSLKAGAGDSDKFSINASTGDVTLLESPDYETKNSYTFTVISKDIAGNKSEKLVTLAINDLNEPAVIGGDLTKSVTEADTAAAISTSGTLTISDVDSSATFIAQNNTKGNFGKFSITSAGVWTYTADSAHDEFAAGKTYTDSFTVKAADGTAKVVSVNILGTNDAAVIGGATAVTITEANIALQTSGQLTISDVDSAASFIAQTNVAGNNGYGKFTLSSSGVWTYLMDNAHDEFAVGKVYTDSFTATSADGTSKVVTVSINGSEDAPYITGAKSIDLIENDAVQTTGGTLTVVDPDSVANNVFVAQTNIAGSGNYGKFSIDTAGTWKYVMTTAHDEFQAGKIYTDTITVKSAGGLSQVLTVNITGTNDAAIISGPNPAPLTETNAVLNASGSLTATDVDSAATFVAQTGVAGSNGYGKFSITTAGAWTYVTDTAHNEFVGGQTYTDSFTVSTADGTKKVVTVTINGTDDIAVIGGDTTKTLTEVDAAVSTSGTLTVSDIDSTSVNSTFVAQTNVVKTYGTFNINAAGEWTYVMNGAHNELAAGSTYTDSFTVATTTPGVTKVVTVNIIGTNDAAVITGVDIGGITEAGIALSATGTLKVTDVDSAATFIAQTGTLGSTGYGKFSITTAGVWTYLMNTAHDEFAAGKTYTDSFTATSADGTAKVVTVTITGTNDAAVIGGVSTASLIEDKVALTANGKLTITDADNLAEFVIQTNVPGDHGYGKFTLAADGTWKYVMDSAHGEFVAGTNYTDSFTVSSVDGTTKVVTVTIAGSNNAAVITGDSVASLTENDAIQSAKGQLTASDVDSAVNFVAVTGAAGSANYGKFSITTAGAWTYTMNTAHNEFVAGTDYVDTITVKTADGTSQLLSVTIKGTNDAAVITGAAPTPLTENNLPLSTSGQLTVTDVDNLLTFIPQTSVLGSNGYGKFSITTAGRWTYMTDTAHDEFVGGKAYTDSFTVSSLDGTTKVVTVTINGTDDAAFISGTSTVNLQESDDVQQTGGTITVTDVDSVVVSAFVAQTNVVKTYGTFNIDAAGVWTYVMNGAHNEFVAGKTYTDSFTVKSTTGLSQVITVNIAGTNDAAVIGGVNTASLTENNVAQTASGLLTITDVDSAQTFVAQTAVSGSNGYGKFSLTAAGAWTYSMNTAHDEFLLGQVYTDSFTVAATDGTTKVVTVSITGANDAPTLSYVDTGISNTDTITRNPLMTVSSLEAAATWEYQVDGGEWMVGTGTTFNMVEGQHTYNVRQTDSLKNVSAITSKTVTLDTLAPNAAGVTLNADSGVSNTDGVTNNGNFTVALSSDTSNWQYSTNGGSTWNNGTGTGFALGSGTYAANGVQVQAFDKAGNSTISKYAPGVTVDTSAPTVAVSIGNTSLQFGQSSTVSFKFSEAVYGFDRSDVSVSGGSLSNISGSGNSYTATFTAGSSYNAGSYVSVATSSYTDLAGNGGSSGSTGSFRVGPNVQSVACSMSLYVSGYGHASCCDKNGYISLGINGNSQLAGATLRLYSDTGESWTYTLSGGSMSLGTFAGGYDYNVTHFHADVSYNGVTASVGGGAAYEVTYRGLFNWGLFQCIQGDKAYTYTYSSPIVLDLNGDGVQTVDAAHGALFDMAGDGNKQSVGWVGKHDALLVRDVNHDGQINNGTELFGSNTLLKNGEKAGDGWAALAEMDTNGDGKVDAKDAAFGEIKVWIDANGDGVTDAGELQGLSEAGIQSIDVAHAVSNTTQNGNVLFGAGQFTKTNGTTAAMTDAWFEVGTTLTLDFTQVKDQPVDMTDGKAQTLKIDLKDLLAQSQSYGALQITGDAGDSVQIVNGGIAVIATKEVVNGEAFNAYDFNHDGLNDLLVLQTMHQAQFA
jgi:VCBS repeat-containing protein